MFRAGFLVFLRVGAAMAVMPAFGEQSVPQRVKLVLALAFTAVVAPAVVADLPPAWDVRVFATETLAGLVIGMGLRLFVIALQVAGAIAAQATSLSQLFGGTGPEPQPAIGNLLVVAGLALAVAAGLHVRVAELFIGSYAVLPAGRLPGAADVAQLGLGQIAAAFALGFTLAMPFVIASAVYNVAIGVINRAMPQLMVSFVGAPALTAGGLILLLLVAPVALAVWGQALQAHFAAPFTVGP
jgi:flagellar biosynthetic protein FliR